ncbi:MAG: tyrosine-type recombinase/integrase [Treponema sp.]|nr:tyrosine-type recombinase/integrase [Treponema sp.]
MDSSESVQEQIRKLVQEKMMSNRYSKHYIAETDRNIRIFYSWAESRNFTDITQLGKKELIEYELWTTSQNSKNEEGEPLSVSAMNSRLNSVKHVFSMLYIQGLIEANPLHGITYKITSGKKSMRHPMSKEEIASFLEKIDISTPAGLRDRAIFELMYSSGLRVSEAAQLRIGDISFEKREGIVRGKFDRDRVVPISHAAIEFLRFYLSDRIQQKEQFVFLNLRKNDRPVRGIHISRIFRSYLRKFGMDRKEISAHSIRHSTATHLLNNGASVRHVQEILGHKDIQTTVRYTHVQTEHIAKEYRKYHPREHDLFEAVDEEYEKRLESLEEDS